MNMESGCDFGVYIISHF